MIAAGDIAAHSADFRRFRDRGMTNIISATGRRRLSQIHPLIKLEGSPRKWAQRTEILSRLCKKKIIIINNTILYSNRLELVLATKLISNICDHVNRGPFSPC